MESSRVAGNLIFLRPYPGKREREITKDVLELKGV